MLLVFATTGVLTVARSDDDRSEHDAVREAVRRGEVLPLPQVLDIVEQRLPGEVLEVELEHEHGRLIYEIKVLTEAGRVRKIEVDARNGDVRSIEDD
jgi:uncharacterized membrane protein YkoI